MAPNVIDKAKDLVGMGTSSHEVDIGGFKVHDTGYGLMGLTWRQDPPPREQAFATMKAALDAGANFWNGGTFYGPPEANSLQLLNAYFLKYPGDVDKVVVSIKGGISHKTMKPDGSPNAIRQEVEMCNELLGKDGCKKTLDIFECARVDPATPIEITMRALEELIQEGKLRAISLSECSADTIRRAAKVAKIAAVEVEVSMWATEIWDNGVAKACADNNITIVAYSPLGRGFLTGSVKSRDDLPEGDMRRHMPRFQPGAFEKNLEALKQLQDFTEKKGNGATPGQVGLAWLKAQGKKPGNPRIVPIPGSSSPERLKENMVDVELSENDVKELDAMVESASIEGERYPPALQQMCFGDSAQLTGGAMEAAFAGK